MSRSFRSALTPVFALSALSLAALLLGGCDTASPAERVAEQRSRYTAELNSFVLAQEPAAPPEVAPPEVAEAGEAAMAATATEAAEELGEEMEGGMDEEMETGPVSTDVLLDIMLRTTANEPLPGITVDFTHVDGDRQPKDRRLLWIETSTMTRGRPHQLTYRVEDVDYTDGDGFHIEIRNPVPEAERGDYAEFAEAGEG